MIKNLIIFLLIISILKPVNAEEIKFDFFWGNIPLCNNGKPVEVKSPTFIFSSLPKDAKWVYFKIRSKNLTNFDYGGGWVRLNETKIINSGKFNYFSPCPKTGKETFEWTAYFTSKKSSLFFYGQPLGVIFEISAKRDYP